MEKQEGRYLYFDIPKQERESAISFLLSALLKSRTACRLPSNQSEFDEDVNIYLAHLLFASSLPDYQTAVERYLSTNVSDMAELVEKNEDRIVRYFIYKVNADHLMVRLGIFQDLDQSGRPFGKTQKQFASMAQNYYQQAATYNRQIYRRSTAVGTVLEKLANGFGRYQTVLHFARKEFFHFSNQFQDESFQKFCEDIKHYEKEEMLHSTIDQFLDIYAEWLETRNEATHAKLLARAKELERLNPTFSFNRLEGNK